MSVLYQRRTSAIASGKRGEETSVKQNEKFGISAFQYQVSFPYAREYLVPCKSMGETLSFLAVAVKSPEQCCTSFFNLF